MPAAFLVATVLELIVLHLVIPWAWLSIALGVASVWSLVVVFAVVVADIVYPHYVTDRELVLRRSGRVVARVPLPLIETVAPCLRYNHTATAYEDGRLFLAGPDGTTVDLKLREPVAVRVDSLLPSGRIAAELSRISLSLDEPDELGREVAARELDALNSEKHS